ncbi:MAG: MFS transporter [Actinomycetaceae bacterium]|nr:MFS transporter [Actinomycetaceae bacterium]
MATASNDSQAANRKPSPGGGNPPVDEHQILEFDDRQLSQFVGEVEPSGKRRSMFAVAAVATLGSLLFGYDTGVISGALPYMYMPNGAGGLHLTALEEGMIGGILTFGAAFGALIGGRLSDRYGRRHNLLLLALLFAVGALGNAMSPNIWVLYPFRFVLGFAVGGASATVPVFLAETAPKSIRGTVVAVDQLMIVTGQLLAFTMNSAIAALQGPPHLQVVSDPAGILSPAQYTWDQVHALEASHFAGDTQAFYDFTQQLVVAGGNAAAWRYMLLLCTLPAIGLWIGMRLMPESARWYVAQGRFYEAIGALKRVRSDEHVGAELQEMLASQREKTRTQRLNLREVLATPWLRKLMLVGIFLAVVNQTTGVNTVMYYAPKVLGYAGMETSAAIYAQVGNGVMSVIGGALGLWLIVRFSRRQLLIADVLGVGFCLLAIAAVFHFTIAPAIDGGHHPPAWAPYTILLLMGLFMLIVQSSNGTVVWTMLGEIFPASARGVMNGAAVFSMWIANAIITAIFPIMMQSLGGALTYTIFGVLNLLIAVVLYRIMPETRGKSMEEIEVYVRQRYA